MQTISISPSTDITTTSVLRCDTISSDDDGDPLELSLTWTDQNDEVLGQDRELELSPTIVSPLTMVTCTATVNDGLEIVQDSDSVLVNNQPPVIDSISIEPDTARIGDDVQCTIVARDPDLETPVTGIEWFQNGEFVSSEPVLTLEPATFHKGDTIECGST